MVFPPFNIFKMRATPSAARLYCQVYVEGILIGDCSCNKMQIRFAGCVTGNLQCSSLGMDPSVVLKVGQGICALVDNAQSPGAHSVLQPAFLVFISNKGEHKCFVLVV